jgi:hypothetical protein
VVSRDHNEGVVTDRVEDGLEPFIGGVHGALVTGFVSPLREVGRRSVRLMHLPDVQHHEPGISVRPHPLDNLVAPPEERHLVSLPMVLLVEASQHPRLGQQGPGDLGIGPVAGFGERLRHRRQ